MEIVGIDSLCNLIEALLSQSYAIACIGTYLRSDDRAALELCTRISDLKIPIVVCEYGLENCLHEIVERGLKRIAIFDAAKATEFFNGVAVLSVDEVDEMGISISTHMIPMKNLLEYLHSVLGDIEVVVVGIPAKNLEIGFDISPEVLKIIDALAQCFHKIASYRDI